MDQGQQNIPRMVEGFLAPILTTKSENFVSPTEQCYEDEINKGYAHSQLTMKSKKKSCFTIHLPNNVIEMRQNKEYLHSNLKYKAKS